MRIIVHRFAYGVAIKKTGNPYPSALKELKFTCAVYQGNNVPLWPMRIRTVLSLYTARGESV